MTARDALNKQKRSVAILFYFTLALFLLGLLLSAVFPAFVVVGFWGFGIVLVTLVYACFAIRCPVCRALWGIRAMRAGPPFSISKEIKSCPHCGIDLDAEDERVLRNRS